MKTFPAILAAFLITLVVGASMFVIGGNALFNPNSGPVLNTPQQAQVVSPVDSSAADSNAALIQQYQQREKQYQAQLQEASKRLEQANQQLQKETDQLQFYTQIVNELQQRGIIRIDPDGQVFLPRARFGNDD